MTELYDQVYREYLERAKDPAWRLAFEIYLGELMQDNALYHQGQIQVIADRAALKQLQVAKSQITKSFLIERMAEIRKTDKKDFKESNWVRSHGQFAQYVGSKPAPRRNAQGLPVGTPAQNYHEVVRDEISRLPVTEQGQSHRLMGLLSRPVALPVDVSDADHKADVLTRAAELTHDLENKTRDPNHKQRIQYLVTNPSGYSRIITPAAGAVPGQGTGPNEIDWEGGERVQYMTPVGPDNPVHVAGQVMNVGLVAGADSNQASKLGSVASDIKTTLNSTKWGEKLQATANVLRVINDNSPLTAQAHAVATLVNLIGPDAARAFGPKLRQLTYRYTGQEALPEQYSDVAKSGRQTLPDGRVEPIAAYERRLIEDLAPSIPTRKEYAASLQAGSTPPSKGYILDKDGKVVSEAVGFADDWYTPFNLRKLPNLRGGSYVRTRGYGGLTTEDLRLAMRTGAKRVTVVSNNGTFTMEFEPRALHWGHRFGFGGGIMLRRYAKSLDAINGGVITDPSEGTNSKLSLNAKGYQTAMQDLAMKYPYWITKPSQSQPFWRPGIEVKGIRERQGDPDDEGYVNPLGIRAQKAKAGFTDTRLRELWANDRTGKFAYDTHEQYQLMQDQKLRVIRGLTGAPTVATGTGNGTRVFTSTSTAANAGAVSGERAYPQQEKLTGGQMDSILHDVRRLMEQADKLGVKPNLKDFDHLAALEPLFENKGSYTGDPEYQRIRAKLAENPDVRKELAEEIGDAFGGKVKGVEELLPRLHSEVRDEDDEEAGAAAAAEQYGETDHIPSAVIASSPAVKRLMNKFSLRANDKSLDDIDQKNAQAIVNGHAFYMNKLRQIEQNPGQYPFRGDGEEKAFNRHHKLMVSTINDERARSEDPGDTGDDGSRTTAVDGVKLPPNILQLDLDEAVADMSATAFENRTEEQAMNYMQEQAAALNRAASVYTKKNMHKQAEHMTNVATALLNQIEELEQSANLSRRLQRD